MKSRHLPFSIGALLIVLLILVGFMYRQFIIDQINLWTFKPTSQVKSLASDDDLTSLGQRYFYATRPQIDGRSDFNKFCGEHEQAQTVLGCYTDDRIYVFNVTSSELDGVMQVTAAHEMLHAAYARLSSSDRQHVDTLLSAEAKTLSSDKVFASRMSVYAKLPKGEYLNELHSVIGTEVTTLPSALNDYYARYFNNRSVITGYYTHYASVFSDIQDEANQLIATLNQLATTINTEVQQYNTAANQLSSDISAFNTQAARRGGFESQSQFDASLSALMNLSNDLDAERNDINAKIEQYHSDEDKLNSMEAHLSKLNTSIDSNLQPVPEVKSAN